MSSYGILAESKGNDLEEFRGVFDQENKRSMLLRWRN
jgi:hypothetical protein